MSTPFTTLKIRRGFTLIEVLAAILIIDVGLLALVGASAVLVRRTNEVHARAAAYRAASNRIELLGAEGCVPSSGVVSTADGMRESWSATPLANSVLELQDSVVFGPAASPHRIALQTRLPC